MLGIKEGLIVYRNSDVEFEKQLKNSRTKRQIAVNINISDNNIEAIDEDNNKISIFINSEELAKNQEK